MNDGGAYGGLTKREYAAIHLRVPRSGNDELDEMIREAQRHDLAVRAMGWCVGEDENETAAEAFIYADAMLKEGEK
jgi:hypothetical protein